MALIPFTAHDFPQLNDWINSAELNRLWGGPTFQFPLDKQQLEAHCSQTNVYPFLYECNNAVVGYVELVKVETDNLRICRVFIAPEHRGRSYSSNMLHELLDVAKLDFNPAKLSLAVFSHNTAARKCYESLGFITISVEANNCVVGSESWDLIRMEKYLAQ